MKETLMVSSSRTGLAVSIAAVLSAGIGQAQTVDEIVAKNLNARGGVEKLKALNSTKVTADVEQQGTKIHQVVWAKRPNLMRREMEATPPPPAPNRASIPPVSGPVKVVLASDGNTVWVVSPMIGEGPQQIAGPQAEMLKTQAEFDSVLLDYKSKGHRIDLLGTEPIDGKPAYHLRITLKNGLTQHSYIDVATGLEVRTSAPVDQNGVKTDLITDLSNYQTIDGFAVPFSMRQSVNGATVAQMTIAKWEMNIPMDDELFKMPARK
jgi:outer membrane lipoprotein-sorting protein